MSPAAGRPSRIPLRLRRAPVPWDRQAPTWREAKPGLIADALKRAQSRPSGNWYVIGASRDLPPGRTLGVTVGSTEVVAWRDAEEGSAPGRGPARTWGRRCATARSAAARWSATGTDWP